ncbi:plasma-membrane proton-efflux P-type ATPase [Candidatus Parvarchaeota archaeon]|uniref:Plasma-membrane proton-efflux P-type ATPase n=1 Tax=Candidatus Acidifodinimicrobium mancum TaxID=2898728 RepID=A0A8T3URK5_9ARCH|nr:plasma-membrane proton-efflux P-type ATPase [Candidatus Acidifodinimicrobium mancum]
MDRKTAEGLSIEEALKQLNSGKDGLSEDEAKKRLEQYGLNEIQTKKQNVLIKFLSKFIGTIPLMLYIIIAISIVLNKYIDAYIVIGLLIFNGITSFLEEYKADNTLELLKNKLSVLVKVERGGEWKTVQSKFIVPGDIIRIRLGDIAPADCKIIESDYLSVDQSMLTGESLPVDKKTNELVFSSSVVREGEATGVVISTGKNTAFGKTAELVKIAKTRTHLEASIFRILEYLLVLDVALIAAIFIGSYFFGIQLLLVVPFSLLILLTSVPVALPAAFTVAMAYGTERLSSKNILVTKLEAIEEASTMTVICLDKTGTITKNQLSISDPIQYGKFSNVDVFRYAALASRVEDNDQIDLAIIHGAQERKIDLKDYTVKTFRPFDPSTKTSSAVVSFNGNEITVLKGFPESVMETCKLSSNDKNKINSSIDEMASKGYRTIAVAYKDGSKWNFVGVIPMNDKPREDSKKLIDELRSLDLNVKMLTGDNENTAKAIAKEVDIGDNILDVSALKGKSEKEIAEIITRADGFAGVYPKDKYTIVKALQDNGFHVGMTGDGVNDAPALKQAEVGIAVSNATDVAKSAADIVLTSEGIEPIVNAIKESRSIFERMITYTLKKVSRVLQTSIFLSIFFLILRFLPMRSIQLILALFLSDIGSISLSTDNELYSNHPDTWNIKVVFLVSLMFGIVAITQVSVLAYFGLNFMKLPSAQFQTFIFLIFIASMELMTLSMRERRSFWSSMPSALVLSQIIVSIAVAVILSYYGILMTAISLYAILLVMIVSILFLLLMDRVKLLAFRRVSEFRSI